MVDDKHNINENQMQSLTLTDEPFDQVMNLLHGKTVQRKISSDYVKIIEQTEQARRNQTFSLRSFEYAKTRPFLTVSQYQLKNQEYKRQLKENNTVKTLGPHRTNPKVSSAN